MRGDEFAFARLATKPYLEVVSRYRGGDFAAAVAEIRGWTRSQVRRALDGLAEQSSLLTWPPVAPEKVDVLDVEGALVLHTNAGLRALEQGADEEGDFHLEVARQNLLQLLGPFVTATARSDAISSREWHLAVTTALTGLGAFEKAETLARRSLTLFPEDAELHLAAGVSSEELANERERELAPARPDRARPGFDRTDRERAVVREGREAARRHYDASLRLDPHRAEARLRLGRLLMRDAPREARDHLDKALAVIDDPRLAYLAHLFKGALEEREGRPGEAVSEYRKAVELAPGAQTGRVALAHALDRTGAVAEAQATLRTLFLGAKHRGLEDAWWLYPLGQYEQGLRLLESFRNRVARRP